MVLAVGVMFCVIGLGTTPSLYVCLSLSLLYPIHTKFNWLQCVAFLSREYSTQFSMIRLKLMLSATCGKEIRPFLVAVQRFMYSVHIE